MQHSINIAPDAGFDNDTIARVKDAMNGNAFDYGNNVQNLKSQSRNKKLGSGGRRLFVSDKSKVISTDWLAFFRALNGTGDKLPDDTSMIEGSDKWQKQQHADYSRRYIQSMDGMQDLLPKGLVTVSLTVPEKREAKKGSTGSGRRDRGKGKRASLREHGGSPKDKGGEGKKGDKRKFGGPNCIPIKVKEGSAPVVQVDIIVEDYGRLNLGFTTKSTKKKKKTRDKVSGKDGTADAEVGDYYDADAEAAAAALIPSN